LQGNCCAAADRAQGGERAADDEPFAVRREPDQLTMTRAGRTVVEYVFRDEQIPRPYFTRLHAPDGTQLTRSHPPVEGLDATDHGLLHPGLWLAFGDLNGVDFWRQQGRIEHVRFVQEPHFQDGRLTWSVEEQYLAPDGAEVCRGGNEFALVDALDGTLLLWSSELRRDAGPLTFGPQHEMGLGLRMATPLTVAGGAGRITGSHGGVNEAGNWGRAGAWWDYSGTVAGRRAGLLVVAGMDNPRPVWSHARDYGLLALNPTGPPPEAKDGPSLPFTLEPGEPWRARFGVLLYSRPDAEPWDVNAAATSINAALEEWRPARTAP
jgi:hypothetical protein